MILFSHKDDCKHGFKVIYILHAFYEGSKHLTNDDMQVNVIINFICSGGHESGVHRLDGPQAGVCEHHQQGGQQVKTFSRDAPISTFQLQLKNLC